MVRTKLDKLKLKINHYLGIPYWINSLKNGKVIKNGPYGGKGSHQQISLATRKAAKLEKLSLSKLNPKDVCRLQKRHSIGIDCSGLAYQLLNYWHKLNKHASIKPKIIGVNRQKGPRKVNVHMLADPQNSTKLNSYSKLKTADLIIVDKKKHVLFIIEANKDKIRYIHSSQKSLNRGVHQGTLTITNPDKNLKYQSFTDKTNTGQDYNQVIFPKHGDGIYRLNIFKHI